MNHYYDVIINIDKNILFILYIDIIETYLFKL